MFTEHKITEFKNIIAKLADRPQMSAQALKAYFDSSAEELRVAHNALTDALSGFSAGAFTDVHYNAADGKLSFVLADGSAKTVDLPLELLVQSGHYDADTQVIVLELANGDTITIPAGDLVDTYMADEKTLMCKENTFAVKDGVFAKEAPKDDVLYGRKNGNWEELEKELKEIKLREADDILEGIYIVTDACADWSCGTAEEILSNSLLIASKDTYYDGECYLQMLLLANGELWRRKKHSDTWDEWQSVIPSLEGYATESNVDTKIADVRRERKLKLLKTITLEEDVHAMTVEFDKPLDELAILWNFGFNQAVTDSFIARTDGGVWFMFFVQGLALKTTPTYFYAHAKEVCERLWETTYSGTFMSNLQGAVYSTTTPKLVMSRRRETISRYLNNIQFYAHTSDVDMVAGSTIEIWGHEADENL